jgi:choline kinase
MQSVILAAGRGSRLGAENQGLPKALICVNGTQLIKLQLRLIDLIFPELSRVAVVVGHMPDLVKKKVGPAVQYVTNEAFARTNTAASLYLALSQFPEETLVINGDVLFDLAALSCLGRQGSLAVCEFKQSLDFEEVQVTVNGGGSVSRIGKGLPGDAEAVGMYRISSQFVESYLSLYSPEHAHLYYEDLFNSLLLQEKVSMSAVPLEAALAIEIDTPADLQLARDRAKGLSEL